MALEMNFDHEDLLKVYTNPQIANVLDITEVEAKTYAEPVKRAMLEHGCTTRRRAAHYLAQAGYESGCFNWLEEFGGPHAWYAPYYGRGAIMLTHKENYQAIGDLMGVNIANDPSQIGCKNNDPVEWPRNIALCMEVGPAFFRWKNLWSLADQGDAGFEPIMLRVLGSVHHPSYHDRWALYKAMINKLPRPLLVET